MLRNSGFVARDFTNGFFMENKSMFPDHLDMVRFTYIHLLLFGEYLKYPASKFVDSSQTPQGTEASGSMLQHWLALWPSIAMALNVYWTSRGWTAPDGSWYTKDSAPLEVVHARIRNDDGALAAKCLDLMGELDSGALLPGTPSFFPDGLVTALGPFVIERPVSEFSRPASLTARYQRPPTEMPLEGSSQHTGR